MPAILKQRPFAPAAEQSDRPSAALVAAVIASVEDCADQLHGHVSHRQFRELVRARGRLCDEALLELRRAALAREAEAAPDPDADGAVPPLILGRRRITGRAVTADAVRVRELEAENARLRQIVVDQRLDLQDLRASARR